MKKSILKNISLAIILILASCATDYRRWPLGGEADRISPSITFHTPQSGSLNQDKNITAEIEFSEFIDYGSTRNAITISPFSAQEKSKIIWYEKSVKIEFSDLDDDQTVLIALNSSLMDLRKNNIKNNFILNFSTGEKIDKKEFSGNINGAIIDDNIENMNYSKLKVNLYRQADFLFYRINKINPEYRVGVSSDMSYKFSNISSDIYVPVVFYDVNNNSKIELENEYISLTGSIDLKSNEKQKFDFTLAKSDTIPPFISEVTQIEKDILQIELSEKVNLNKNMLSSIIQGRSAIEFQEFYNEKAENKLYIRSKELDVTKEIMITLNDLIDPYGNTINDKMKTKTVFIADTVKKQKLRVTPNFKEKIYNDQSIAFNFNWIEPDSIQIELINSLDSSIAILNDMVVEKPFISEINMSDKVFTEGKYSIAVKYGEKKIFTKNINIENDLGYGSVSGKVKNSSTQANLIFKNCDNSSQSDTRYGVTSDYKIQLRPGRYICGAYLDDDSNELFTIDIKQLNCEKSVIRKDTILVRKNWESADINFDF
ncbi:MAG: Ig-like domain-containing protein [Candidatus Delongbacteria bacterium]|jgi:hypothetical protein|nr:Ig-like domain-containing protein [Candidatus Delongbacteria bacterium]